MTALTIGHATAMAASRHERKRESPNVPPTNHTIHGPRKSHRKSHSHDLNFRHRDFSWDCCVRLSDDLPVSSAMRFLPNIPFRMIPWYPAIGPESENARGRKPRQAVRNMAVHSPEPAQPTGTLRTANPSICRHASVTCPDRRRAWLRNDASQCPFRSATPLLVLQFQQFVGECRRGYAGTYPSKAADYGQ